MSKKQLFEKCAFALDALVAHLNTKYHSEGYEVQVLNIDDPNVHGKVFSVRKIDEKEWLGKLKSVSGMANEATARLVKHGEDLDLEIVGKWLDKAAVMGVSMLILWPLFFTSSIGAWTEHKLLDKIYADIISYLASISKVETHVSVCPKCNQPITTGAVYCGNCGQRVG
jgi:hypothetical protein